MIDFALGFIFAFCILLCYHAATYLLREKPSFINILDYKDALASLHKKIDDLSYKKKS